MCSRRPAQLIEQQGQRVEFGAETSPVPGLQPIDSPIISASARRARSSAGPAGEGAPTAGFAELLPSAFVAEGLYADRGFVVWSRAPWGTGFLR